MLYRQKSKTDIMSMFKSLERNLMVLLCSNYYQDILIETEKIMVMRNKAAGLWIFLTNYSLKYSNNPRIRTWIFQFSLNRFLYKWYLKEI